MTRRSRVLVVSLGLVVSGGLAGALAGAVVGFLTFVAGNGPNDTIDPTFGAYFGAALGAQLGAVLFPLAGWLLMRRVAHGRARLGTAVGTIVGGVIGWFLPFSHSSLDLVFGDSFTRVLDASVAGFLLAVLVLRRSAVASEIDAVTPSGSVP
jgi:hypothetical protein